MSHHVAADIKELQRITAAVRRYLRQGCDIDAAGKPHYLRLMPSRSLSTADLTPAAGLTSTAGGAVEMGPAQRRH
jgi:hypothetical protein